MPYAALVEVGAFSMPNASLYTFMRSLSPELVRVHWQGQLGHPNVLYRDCVASGRVRGLPCGGLQQAPHAEVRLSWATYNPL